MKIVVHPGTATILNAYDCVMVDLEALSSEDALALLDALEEGFDLEVAAIAERAGTPVAEMPVFDEAKIEAMRATAKAKFEN